MLLQRAKVKPVAAVERLAGMQAQVARPPFVGLWSRLDGFEREDLVRPIERREIVRATMMRATLHLMSRADFLALRPALQPSLARSAASTLKTRSGGLDLGALIPAARAYFEAAPRTFAELRDHLSGVFPGLDERAMGYTVRLHLPLIQTPVTGAAWAYPAAASFAVAESWLGEPTGAGAGPHALVLRYLAAFGPADARDFQTWSGVASARTAFDELRPKLRTFRDERGRELFDVPTAPRPSEDADAPVRFLPEFDNLVLAYADRTRLVADAHRPALFTKNLLVPATFLVDGDVAGIWTVERKKRLATLAVKPFGALGARVRNALGDEAERLLRFIEPDAETHAVDFVKKGK
jgi:hypothetical protein